MKYFILLLALLITGCGFGRRDVWPDGTESATVWTLFKEIEFKEYKSKNNEVDAITPWGAIKSDSED